MTDPQWLDEAELASWQPLAALLLLLPTRLDEELQPTGLSFFDYSALVMLERAPRRQLAMKQLARVASASLSRSSHAAKRLEGRGLVERSQSPSDRRVTLVTLTDEGLGALRRSAPAHVSGVRRAVLDALSPEELAQLGGLAAKIVAHLHPEGAPPVTETESVSGA